MLKVSKAMDLQVGPLIEADRRYFCNLDGIFWSYLRGILTVGRLKKQFKPGTIRTSEFTLGKDTVLVFQDACKPALVNTDDGNYAFGRILAHWD